MKSDPKSPAKPDPAKSSPAPAPVPAEKVPEIGGRKGPDPVRYGDWENAGKCVDF